MANVRIIQQRIRSIKNTEKITKAMEMIATTKMRRAQERVLASRPYSEKMLRVVAHLASEISEAEHVHPLLENRPVHRIAVVHIASDRGLCGGFNSNINKDSAGFLLEQSVPVVLITIGRKGSDFMHRYGRDIQADFTGITDCPELVDSLPISRIVIDDYIKGIVDQVYLAYTRFVSTAVQRPALQQLLPVEPLVEMEQGNVEYIYEPSKKVVLGELLPRFVEMQVYHALLESVASEQSARMMAMRNATENASELIDGLTLTYNKARQEAITKELLDITGGVEAMA
ncbi:MAG: ATP synthase F1 subunit gamma [Chloroflexota bacterium]|nr:ATP synthase F1 subunit gamma [Chloroflexota bacterium]